jgi:hypothetical protein
MKFLKICFIKHLEEYTSLDIIPKKKIIHKCLFLTTK